MLDQKITEAENKVNALHEQRRADDEVIQAFEMEVINLRELRRLGGLYPSLVYGMSPEEEGHDETTMSTTRIVRYVNVYNDGGIGSLHDDRKHAEINAEKNSVRVAKLVEVFDEPDNSIETAINDAANEMRESSQERKPIHFFMPVDKLSGEIGTPVYGSYKECRRDNGDNYRVGEFKEVVAEDSYTWGKGYCWANLYGEVGMISETVSTRIVDGGFHHTRAVAVENIDHSRHFLGTVMIRRPKGC